MRTPARLHTCTSARFHVCTPARLHVFTSAHLHVCTFSRLHAFTSADVMLCRCDVLHTEDKTLDVGNRYSAAQGIGKRRRPHPVGCGCYDTTFLHDG